MNTIFNPSVVFQLASTVALLTWISIIFLPKWRMTHRRYAGGIVSLLLFFAMTYLIMIIIGSDAFKNGGGFNSIEEVRILFANDHALVAGWIHYLAFDLFVGLWMADDAKDKGIPHWAMILPLIGTFLFGPAGWLLYQIALSTKRQRIQ